MGQMAGHPVRRWAAIATVAGTVALLAGGLALAAANGDLPAAVPQLTGLVFSVVGALVVIRLPANRVGWLLCAIGVLATLAGAAEQYARYAYLVAPGSLPMRQIAAGVMVWTPIPIVGLLAALLPSLFPDGRPVSRRWRFVIWAGSAYVIVGTIGNGLDVAGVEGLPGVSNPSGVPVLAPLAHVLLLASVPFLLIGVLGGLVSMVVRWRRALGDERQQVKWLLAAVAPLLIPLGTHQQAQRFSEVALSVLLGLIPIAIGVAVLRYRLYDLDMLINRALVYAVLSVAVAAVYVSIVTVGVLVVGAGHSRWTQVLATVAAALVLQPLRAKVQWAVDRLLYGDRSTPYDALTRLGRMLERAPVPETVLQGVVDTVADALRLPYVAIELQEEDRWRVTATHGSVTGTPEFFPMVYQEEQIGRLAVGRRAAEEEFTRADRRLLADLARQAGVAAHAIQLTLALQRSRAALITAREEERRRLRRDLHDGLGPALSGVTLGLHAARVTLRRDMDRADQMLLGLAGQVDDAIADIRRLVYGLRPPALDELGLAGALSLHATRIEGTPDGPAVVFDLPATGLETLPAAVTSAAYRIVTEALTNVARHARARSCRVRMTLGTGLDIEVIDDGRGVSGSLAGVGISGMRERATELGGTLRIDSAGTGTRVHAHLPIMGIPDGRDRSLPDERGRAASDDPVPA